MESKQRHQAESLRLQVRIGDDRIHQDRIKLCRCARQNTILLKSSLENGIKIIKLNTHNKQNLKKAHIKSYVIIAFGCKTEVGIVKNQEHRQKSLHMCIARQCSSSVSVVRCTM